MTTAQDIMSTNCVTCPFDTNLNEVARRMWEHDIGMVPITDGDGRLVGTLTDRDIAMGAYIQGRSLRELPVSAVMSNSVQTVRPETPLSQVEELMARHQVRRIPVVDASGQAVGIISLNDLARTFSSSRESRVSANEVAQTMRAICEARNQPAHSIAAE
jgi:CBS-domain-containing membrane protein